MILYHNHIPRTAGTFMQAPLSGLLTSRGVKHSIIYQADNIDDKQIINSEYIFGHIGKYPEILIPNILSYGFVRDPIDRFISTFNFFSKNIFNVTPTRDLLDLWLYDEVLSTSHSNLQSKFITGYSNKELWNLSNRQERVKNGWFISDYSLNIDNIINEIEKSNFASIENYHLVLDWLSDIIYNKYSFMLYSRRYKVNDSEPLTFHIDKTAMNRIKELNEIDLCMYDYIKSTEIKRFK